MANSVIHRARDKPLGVSERIVIALLGLLGGAVLILYVEYNNQPQQLVFILVLYALLIIGVWLYAKNVSRNV